MRVWGAIAIATAAIAYACGSVLSRPLLRRHSPALIASVTTLVGGIALVGASLAVEPGAVAALAGRRGWLAWSGWLFLVRFGSLVGYTIYLRLLRDIGASGAGAYAYVSPVVAVLLGVVLLEERVGIADITGVIIMLAAAYLAMTGALAKPDPVDRPS